MKTKFELMRKENMKSLFVGFLISVFILLIINLSYMGGYLYNLLPDKIWIILYMLPVIMLLGSFFFMIKEVRRELKNES